MRFWRYGLAAWAILAVPCLAHAETSTPSGKAVQVNVTVKDWAGKTLATVKGVTFDGTFSLDAKDYFTTSHDIDYVTAFDGGVVSASSDTKRLMSGSKVTWSNLTADLDTEIFVQPFAPIIPRRTDGPDPWCIKDPTTSSDYWVYTYTTGSYAGLYRTGTFDFYNGTPAKLNHLASGYTSNVWAPEVHYIDGNWYIYYSASSSSSSDTERSFVMTYKGSSASGLMTASNWNTATRLVTPDDKWAIDGTVFEANGQLYYVWSGWPGDRNGQQNIYLAPMQTPTTFVTGATRTLVSAPTETWERQGNPVVNEGPAVLQKNGKVTIVYSGSGSWTQYYALGYATCSDGDFTNPSSWKKHSGAVFSSRTTADAPAWAPGHCSFTQDADGRDYIVYHAQASYNASTGKWSWPGKWTSRGIRTQPFAWHNDEPVFGVPRPTATSEAWDYATLDYSRSDFETRTIVTPPMTAKVTLGSPNTIDLDGGEVFSVTDYSLQQLKTAGSGKVTLKLSDTAKYVWADTIGIAPSVTIPVTVVSGEPDPGPSGDGGVVPVFNGTATGDSTATGVMQMPSPITDKLSFGVWFRADAAFDAGGDFNVIFALGGLNGLFGPAILYMDNRSGKEGVGIRVQPSGATASTAVKCFASGNWCDKGWHQLVGTFDGATGDMVVYVDGVQQATAQSGLSTLEQIQRVSVAVDAAATTSRKFEGSVQEVTLWNRVLTASEVQAAYGSKRRLVGNESGLVGYWPMDDVPTESVSHNGSFTETTGLSPMVYHSGKVSWEMDATMPLKPAASPRTYGRRTGAPDFTRAHTSKSPGNFTYPDTVGARPVRWFTIGGKELAVVVPENPLPGNPWMWAFEWPWTGATTKRCDTRDPANNDNNDIGWYKFIEAGYYYVYLDAGNDCMGNDVTMQLFDQAYRFLTRELGFDAQFVSLGISRGGWNAYRFAQAFPERFKYMYNDAPVCDLRSWPGLSDAFWGRYKNSVKQFHDDAERLAWDGAMTNLWTLAPIAARKVKMLNLIGDRDTTVAPERNTLALAKSYRALGGEIEVVVKPDYGHVHGMTTDEITPFVSRLIAATKTVSTCAHAALQPFDAVPAKCLRNGRTAGRRCTACGQVVSGGDWTPMLGHVYVTNGAGGESCARCNAVYSTRTATGCPHANQVAAGPSWDASCLGKGVTAGVKCADCGTVLTAQTTVAQTISKTTDEHPYDSVTGADGKVSHTCSACGISYTEASGGDEPGTGGDEPEQPDDPPQPPAGGSAVVPWFGRECKANSNLAKASSAYAAGDFSSGDVSVGCWFKLRNNGVKAGNDHPQMVSLSPRNGGSKQISLCCNYFSDVTKPKIFAYVGGQNPNYQAVSAASAIYATGWHYAMGTYDHATHTLKLFVDGELVATKTDIPDTFALDGGAALTVGGENSTTSTRYFNGSVTRVSLWNKVVSDADAKAMHTAKTDLRGDESGLLGYWPCEDVTTVQTGWSGAIADKQTTRTAKDLAVVGTIDWIADADYPFASGGEEPEPPTPVTHTHAYAWTVTAPTCRAVGVSNGVCRATSGTCDAPTVSIEFGEKADHVYEGGKCKWCQQDDPGTGGDEPEPPSGGEGLVARFNRLSNSSASVANYSGKLTTQVSMSIWYKLDSDYIAKGGTDDGLISLCGRNHSGSFGPMALTLGNGGQASQQGVNVLVGGKKADGGAYCEVLFSKTADAIDGEWHHVAGTYDAATKQLTVYFDGVKAEKTSTVLASETISGTWTTLRLGADAGGGAASRPFHGELAEAAVFDRILTEAEVEAYFKSGKRWRDTQTTGLVDYWPLDDATAEAEQADGTFADIQDGTYGIGYTKIDWVKMATPFDGDDPKPVSNDPTDEKGNPIPFNADTFQDTAMVNSSKAVFFPSEPKVDGRTISFDGKSVTMRDYYDVWVKEPAPGQWQLVLELNDNAKPKIADGSDGTKAFVVTDTTVSLHLEHTYETLYYALATGEKLDGTWATGEFEKGRADFTVNRDKSASACFCKIVVSDHE